MTSVLKDQSAKLLTPVLWVTKAVSSA